jgi:AcrR family transcriptional regulator
MLCFVLSALELMMAKVTKQDWVELALKQLAASGHRSVTLEVLLDQLGVSHGSFYHHFKNRTELTRAMLEHWEQAMTLDIVQRGAQVRDISQRIDHLIDMGENLFELQTPLENAIRTWSQSDERVKATMQRVDRLRRQHCQSLAGFVTADKQRAKILGDLVHAIFVGSQQCQPAYTAREIKAIYRELQQLLVAPVSATIDQAGLSS